MRLLLTGFGPFLEVRDNPSARVVEALAAEPGVTTVVLPVSYSSVSRSLPRLLSKVQPDAVLSFGISRGASAIQLERVFLNLADGPPDADGNLRLGTPIHRGAPLALPSTLPLRSFHRSLQQAGIPATFSNHAGAYLCNFIGYRTAFAALQSPPSPTFRSGFIHLPPVSALPLDTQIAAAKTMLACLRTSRST